MTWPPNSILDIRTRMTLVRSRAQSGHGRRSRLALILVTIFPNGTRLRSMSTYCNRIMITRSLQCHCDRSEWTLTLTLNNLKTAACHPLLPSIICSIDSVARKSLNYTVPNLQLGSVIKSLVRDAKTCSTNLLHETGDPPDINNLCLTLHGNHQVVEHLIKT